MAKRCSASGGETGVYRYAVARFVSMCGDNRGAAGDKAGVGVSAGGGFFFEQRLRTQNCDAT